MPWRMQVPRDHLHNLSEREKQNAGWKSDFDDSLARYHGLWTIWSVRLGSGNAIQH